MSVAYWAYPPNVTVREQYWHRPLADVGAAVERESKTVDVYVLQICVDQRLSKNPHGHGVLAFLGQGDEADIFHFPLPFRLHFEATVHAITCAVEIITSRSIRPSLLLVPHYYAIQHALLPSYTSYGLAPLLDLLPPPSYFRTNHKPPHQC
jgi:hypothetical protein